MIRILAKIPHHHAPAAIFLICCTSLAAQQNYAGADHADLASVAPVSAAAGTVPPASGLSSGRDGFGPDVYSSSLDGLSDTARSDTAGSSGPIQNQTPNAPAAQDQRQLQTKRILGIIPNFRAVSTDEKLPPQSVKEKFVTATQDSFDYSSILIPVFLAAYSMGTNAYPEFHQGAAGYARYFWHAAVDQTSENYMVEFIVPTITREDTRYYTLGRGGFMKRAGYALSRAVITRSDSGKEVFNFSEVVGAGASSGLSTLYYPSRERSLSNTGSQWGLDVGIDAASFVFREFWPDVNHKLFRGSRSSATSSQ